MDCNSVQHGVEQFDLQARVGRLASHLSSGRAVADAVMAGYERSFGLIATTQRHRWGELRAWLQEGWDDLRTMLAARGRVDELADQLEERAAALKKPDGPAVRVLEATAGMMLLSLAAHAIVRRVGELEAAGRGVEELEAGVDGGQEVRA